jgi:pimeloyl-ACP methyl ester carboxylesterase
VTGQQDPGAGGLATRGVRDAQLDRDGATISYSVCAAADGQAAGGPPLLLTHGYGASAAMWQDNLAALSAGRTVITWDICGHGRTSSPADPRLRGVGSHVAGQPSGAERRPDRDHLGHLRARAHELAG